MVDAVDVIAFVIPWLNLKEIFRAAKINNAFQIVSIGYLEKTRILDFRPFGRFVSDTVLTSAFAKCTAKINHVSIESSEVSTEAIHELIQTHGPSLEVLNLTGCSRLNPMIILDTISSSCICGTLFSLDLSGCGLLFNVLNRYLPMHHGEFGKSMAQLLERLGSKLRILRLRNCLYFNVLLVIQHCQSIEELEIESSYYGLHERNSDVFPEFPSSMRKLRDRGGILYGQQTLSFKSKYLTGLDISNSNHINDYAILQIVTGMPGLTDLNISLCSNVTNCSLKYISSLQLHRLALHGIRIDDTGIHTICRSKMPLIWLNLSLTSITSASIKSLKVLNDLRMVNVRCCRYLKCSRSDLSTLDELLKGRNGAGVYGLESFECIASLDQATGVGCHNEPVIFKQSFPAKSNKIHRIGWNDVPRGGNSEMLARWEGFWGQSGDLLHSAIKRMHPFTEVIFYSENENPRQQRHCIDRGVVLCRVDENGLVRFCKTHS